MSLKEVLVILILQISVIFCCWRLCPAWIYCCRTGDFDQKENVSSHTPCALLSDIWPEIRCWLCIYESLTLYFYTWKSTKIGNLARLHLLVDASWKTRRTVYPVERNAAPPYMRRTVKPRSESREKRKTPSYLLSLKKPTLRLSGLHPRSFRGSKQEKANHFFHVSCPCFCPCFCPFAFTSLAQRNWKSQHEMLQGKDKARDDSPGTDEDLWKHQIQDRHHLERGAGAGTGTGPFPRWP